MFNFYGWTTTYTEETTGTTEGTVVLVCKNS